MSSKPPKRRKSKPRGEGGAIEEVKVEADKVEEAIKREARKVAKSVEGKKKSRPRALSDRPLGRAPTAMVTTRHGTGMVSREGRGFSFGELSGAGVAFGHAKDWGLMVDRRRRSVIEGNVNSLKGWSSHRGPAPTAVQGVKKAESLLEAAARDLEKGAVEVAEEAEKVVKEVEKETKDAVKRVEKAKPRPRKKKAKP